jgi:hypothetical protein
MNETRRTKLKAMANQLVSPNEALIARAKLGRLGMYWILDGLVPVETDLITWGRWFETADRHVGLTYLSRDTNAEVQVSTVFLGIDHSFGHGIPILFETMVFGGPFDQYTERYAFWEQAEAGHARIVAALKAGKDPHESE